MRRIAEEDDSDGMNKNDLYWEILSGISDRTRQRDFMELEKLGYDARYIREFKDELGRWYYEIPSAPRYGVADQICPARAALQGA